MEEYKIAILFSGEKDHHSPSNKSAIDKFCYAATFNCLIPTVISDSFDLNNLNQFDALFIRDVTYKGSMAELFIKKAEELGLVVIDDSKAIEYGSNKIKACEIARERNILIPKTKIMSVSSRINISNFPVILKSPQGYGSNGVFKANNMRDFIEISGNLFEKYDKIVVQEYLYTLYDWRIAILNNEPLFVMKYNMVKDDWKVADINKEYKEDIGFGKCECFECYEVNKKMIDIAVKVSYALGDGLYGVDIKEYEGKFYFMEINDNISIYKGIEDRLLEDTLYFEIMKYFYEKIKENKYKVA